MTPDTLYARYQTMSGQYFNVPVLRPAFKKAAGKVVTTTSTLDIMPLKAERKMAGKVVTTTSTLDIMPPKVEQRWQFMVTNIKQNPWFVFDWNRPYYRHCIQCNANRYPDSAWEEFISSVCTLKYVPFHHGPYCSKCDGLWLEMMGSGNDVIVAAACLYDTNVHLAKPEPDKQVNTTQYAMAPAWRLAAVNRHLERPDTGRIWYDYKILHNLMSRATIRAYIEAKLKAPIQPESKQSTYTLHLGGTIITCRAGSDLEALLACDRIVEKKDPDSGFLNDAIVGSTCSSILNIYALKPFKLTVASFVDSIISALRQRTYSDLYFEP